MGHFNVRALLTGPTGLSEDVDLFVDTGASLIVLPRPIADRLELRSIETRAVELADGSEVLWPVAELRIAFEGRSTPAMCFIVDRGEPLLGVFALQSLFLTVDPVNHRLVPTRAYAKPSTPMVAARG